MNPLKMKTKRALGIAALLACMLFGYNTSQAQSIDSLKMICGSIWQAEPTRAVKELEIMAEACQQQDDKANFAWTLNLRGIIFGALGKFDSSYAFYDSSLAYCRRHDIMEVEKKTLMNLAINYQYQGRYEESMATYIDAIKRFETFKDTLGLAHACSGLGGIYREIQKPRKSIDVYLRSVKYYNYLGATPLTGPVLSNLGVMYTEIGMEDSARYYFALAEPILIQTDHRLGLMNFHINKAGLYKTDSTEKALEHYASAMKLARELNDPRGIGITHAALAEQALKEGDNRKANDLGKLALEAAEIMDDIELQRQSLKSIYKSALAMGKRNEALDYLIKFKEMSDSVLNLEGKKAMAEMEVKYETEKKEKELAQSKMTVLEGEKKLAESELEIAQQNRTIFFLSGGGILILLLGGGVFLLQKERQQRLQNELELEEARRKKEIADEKLRISRELHDNVGSQITFLVSSLDNMRVADSLSPQKDKLESLSEFGRSAMGDLRTAIWALNKEATVEDIVLKTNDLVQRLSGMSQANIKVQDAVSENSALNSTEAINILRIIQESLQNAVKHSNADQITIKISSNAQQISIEIADNGTGFDVNAASDGFGLLNLKDRAKAIGGMVEIRSEQGSGTRVRFLRNKANG